MYEYKKRPSKIKKVFLIFFLMIIVSVISIFVYKLYSGIDVYSSDEEDSKNQGAVRLSQNINEKNIGEDGEEDITRILEKDIKSVVGISKIKNTGNSIFLNNSTKELGLGTGMIVTENRIYPYKLACCREQIQ